MPGTPFRLTVGTTVAQLTDESELSGVTVTRSGVKVIVVPSASTSVTYYGFSDTLTTANGIPCPNNSYFTINPEEFPLNQAGRPDLTALHFIASGDGQQVGGIVL